MIVKKVYKMRKHLTVYIYTKYYLFGFIPLYISKVEVKC